MNIGEKIKEVLKNRDISYTELAKRMRVSRQMVSSLVRSESITTDTLIKVSQALNEPLTSFFDLNILYGDNEITSRTVNSLRKVYYLLAASYRYLKKEKPDIIRSQAAIKLVINYLFDIHGGFFTIDTDDGAIYDTTFGQKEPEFTKEMEDLINQIIMTNKLLDD